LQAVSEVFKQYDVNRQAQDVTIIKFKESEAQVFSNLKTESKEIETGSEFAGVGRQVTVFAREGDDWKVSSVYYTENYNPKGEIENDNTNEQINRQAVYVYMKRKFDSITNYGEKYIPEIHDPMVVKIAAEYFGITIEEANAIYIEFELSNFE
ncbi:MAG: hypothetical protein ABS938_18245, partial [Psychrobacillus psychrodurans]